MPMHAMDLGALVIVVPHVARPKSPFTSSNFIEMPPWHALSFHWVPRRARALRGASRENTKDYGRGRVVVSFVPYTTGPWPGLVSNEFYARA